MPIFRIKDILYKRKDPFYNKIKSLLKKIPSIRFVELSYKIDYEIAVTVGLENSIGDYAFIGGGFRIVQDVPPYILAMDEPLKYSGLNIIGLRRNKVSVKIRNNMKRAYQLLYQSSLNRSQAISQIKKELDSLPEINNILNFIENSDRGLI